MTTNTNTNSDTNANINTNGHTTNINGNGNTNINSSDPEKINMVWKEFATAPTPTVTITGYTGLITDVRFIWSGTSCGVCERNLRLFTDAGTIHVGIRLDPGRSHDSIIPRWYQRWQPKGIPDLPDRCPNKDCPQPPPSPQFPTTDTPGQWIRNQHTLRPGPIDVHAPHQFGDPTPAPSTVYTLIGDIYTTIRQTFPDLALAADLACRHQAKHRKTRTPRR